MGSFRCRITVRTMAAIRTAAADAATTIQNDIGTTAIAAAAMNGTTISTE